MFRLGRISIAYVKIKIFVFKHKDTETQRFIKTLCLRVSVFYKE